MGFRSDGERPAELVACDRNPGDACNHQNGTDTAL